MTGPHPVLTRAAHALEPRAPRFVARARRAGDRTARWRDSWRHRNYPDPGAPWTNRYVRAQRRLVTAALADSSLLERFAQGEPLPAGYGVGLDERVIEYPWLLARRPRGRVLDAGSTLNFSHVLGPFLEHMDELAMATLERRTVDLDGAPVSYVLTDLRALPFQDGLFDTVICASTLEHIGMDNSRWGVDIPRAADPAAERQRVLLELRRVTAPAGRMLITVPYGVREDHGWFEQFDRSAVEQLPDTLDAAEVDVAVYRYRGSGWARSDLDDASDARYQADLGSAGDPVSDDRAAAARAVACLDLRL
jgi:SAM-dependent methyltransferase